jgi:hypothetical protein
MDNQSYGPFPAPSLAVLAMKKFDKVLRERRWTSPGETPARELVRPSGVPPNPTAPKPLMMIFVAAVQPVSAAVISTMPHKHGLEIGITTLPFRRSCRGSVPDDTTTRSLLGLWIRHPELGWMHYSTHVVPMDIPNKIKPRVGGTLIGKTGGIKRETFVCRERNSSPGSSKRISTRRNRFRLRSGRRRSSTERWRCLRGHRTHDVTAVS